MPALKINRLVNLHDARYCAAIEIEYVGFALERGSMYKLPEAHVGRIASWLEGPRTVLEFGDDTEAMDDYLAEHTVPTETLFQLNLGVDYPVESMPLDRRIIRLATETPEEMAERADALIALSDDVHLVELAPLNGALSEWQETLDDILAQVFNACLDIDAFGADALDEIAVIPEVVSVRERISGDFPSLDFDAFEQFLESPHFAHSDKL